MDIFQVHTKFIEEIVGVFYVQLKKTKTQNQPTKNTTQQQQQPITYQTAYVYLLVAGNLIQMSLGVEELSFQAVKHIHLGAEELEKAYV